MKHKNTMLIEMLIVACIGSVISVLLIGGCLSCFNVLTAELRAQSAQIEQQQKDLDLLKEVIELD